MGNSPSGQPHSAFRNSRSAIRNPQSAIRNFLTRHLLAAACLLAVAIDPARSSQDASPTADTLLVSVNGRPVTAGDLDFVMLSRRVPEESRPKFRQQYLEQLIDKRLMQQFLESRKAEPNPYELDRQVNRIFELIRANGEEPQTVLARLGYSKETLRHELALPLAWQAYVQSIVTPQQLREYWNARRHEFDGTEIRAAHILVKLPADAGEETVDTATATLSQIRADIVAGKLSFADAARRHSEAPSAGDGGDLGFFPYRGKMPLPFSQAAFPLKADEVSRPFRTPFGLHLITVTERNPGQLSLEDVRDLVLKQRGEELWNDLVAELRAKAEIVWKDESR